MPRQRHAGIFLVVGTDAWIPDKHLAAFSGMTGEGFVPLGSPGVLPL